MTSILTEFQLEYQKKKSTFFWQFFARILNLPSELQNSHLENLTLYDLWPPSTSTKNNFGKFFWPDSDSAMKILPESLQRWVPFQWTVFFLGGLVYINSYYWSFFYRSFIHMEEILLWQSLWNLDLTFHTGVGEHTPSTLSWVDNAVRSFFTTAST